MGIIDIYGSGGVGKTTLLTEVNNKFVNTTHDFDVVIWVNVSSNLDLNEVQNDIGKMIGLYDEMWKNKRPKGKKEDICGVLSKKKFVLLLDDMWECLDLLGVGIPLQNKQNSKIVFTTRSKKVCGQMDAQETIEVECLQWVEAWDLFQKKVGETTLKSHLDIPKLAKLVAKECDGLPLALVIVGMENEVFCPLHFSYDSLPTDTVKSCFLYCSLYPEDSDIIVEDLINKWIGEGFLNEWNDNEDGAENQGYDIIDTLLQACLLGKMALWIGREYEKQIDKLLVRAGGRETEAPEVSKWKEVKKMSNKIERLIGTPICPQLTTLLLNENQLEMISSGFFQSMHALKVLDQSRNRNLVDLPLEIGELTSLQYLNISSTRIIRLPVQLQNLVNLKILDMDDIYCNQTSIPQVISGLSFLQVLKIDSVFIDNEAFGGEIGCFEILISNGNEKCLCFPNT
ncbi:unnamed protein product [Ilex paraguariensis]|uniref:NB-ARC domain-containing protein n=1 Tax=Ilex paraguariensis TaxID=185542 RepID=A0ABC8SBK6_9AQUA